MHGKRVAVPMLIALLLGGLIPILPLAIAVAETTPPEAPTASRADSIDTTPDVPELRAMHEVIYPLWHEAWADTDTVKMKSLVRPVREHVEKVRAAALPGILRDHKAEWDSGVLQLVEADRAYEDAAAGSDVKKLLDSVEELHGRFEALMRLTWPVSKQLNDYHVVLYRIYHHSMPAKDVAAIRAQSVELAEKAKALSDAPVPKRFTAKEEEIRSGITRLWNDTEALRMTAQKDDIGAIEAAVEKVHTSYRALEGLYR